MSKYRRILLTAFVAVALGYLAVAGLIIATPGTDGPSAAAMMAYTLGFLLWVGLAIAAQAALIRAQTPDEREALIHLRSDRLAAWTLEGGILALLALALIDELAGPGLLGRLAPRHLDALVLYLLGIVTTAALARLSYALWHEARA